MDQDSIEQACGDQVMPLNSSSRIQEDDDEAFRVRIEIGVIDHMGAPVCRRLIGRITDLHFRWRRTFSQHLNLEFLWIENVGGSFALLWNVEQVQLHSQKQKPRCLERGFAPRMVVVWG